MSDILCVSRNMADIFLFSWLTGSLESRLFVVITQITSYL